MKVDYSGMAENLGSDLKKAIDKNNRSELKRCPFCGGEAMLTNQLATDQYGHKLWNVICFKCDNGTMSYWDKKHVIEKWNTRKPLERVIEKLENEVKDLREDCNYIDAYKYEEAIKIIKEELM